MKPSVLWHFLAVLDSTRCWYSAVFGIPPLLQSLYLPTLIVPQNCEHPFSYQDRTQLHIAQLFISRTLLLVRIAKWGSRYSLRRKTELSVRTRERKANATGSERKWFPLSVFSLSLSLSYKQVLSFLCRSSHHVITGRKKMHTTCYLLTCLKAVTPIFSGICSILSSPAAEKFDSGVFSSFCILCFYVF